MHGLSREVHDGLTTDADETDRPIRRVIENIKKSRPDFVRILKNVPKAPDHTSRRKDYFFGEVRDATLKICERVQTGKPRDFVWHEICSFRSDAVSDYAADYIVDILEGLSHSAVRLYFVHDTSESIVTSVELANVVAKDIAALEPFYNFTRN